MMCFKDMTFCDARCSNMDCHRKFTSDLAESVRVWWSHDPDNAPVAFADFSGGCSDFIGAVR